MSILLNLGLALVFSCILICFIAGSAFLLNLLLSKNAAISDSSDYERTRRKWLYSCSLVVMIVFVDLCSQIFLFYIDNAPQPQADLNFGEKLWFLIFIYILFIQLIYSLGYHRKGTKYILFATIFALLQTIPTPKYISEIAHRIYTAINSIIYDPLDNAIFETLVTTYTLFMIFCVVYYLVNCILLYKANKAYHKKPSSIEWENNSTANGAE